MPLPKIINDLLDPSAYTETPESVRIKQTHISYILLTPEFAYKIKKPVDFGFLDFSTLENRRHFCEEEVRLNKRLAPGMYLGVVGITMERGRARLGGAGRAVEYAVKMRRIPEGAILEEMLKKGLATDALIRRVAGVVAGFHSSADTNAHVSRFGSLEAIKGNASENFSQTRGFISKTISEAAFDRIKAYTEGFLRDNSGLLEERVKRGFIRDCHGDLHLEHIAVDKDIVAFDCIEFSERYRFSDTIADIAFLSMDIDFHNRHDLSIALEDSYIEGSGDTEGRALLNFYKCYRAYVRGKVDGLKSMEGEVGEDERFSSCLSATRHFQLSSMYAKGGFRPELLIFCGLSGAGKTTLANEAERRLAFVRLSSDAIRKGLLCMPVSAKAPAPYKQGIYTDDFTDKTYKELIKRAGGFLRQGISVALDATFQRERFLRQAMEEAKAGGLKPEDVHIVLCTADDEMARENILRREREGHGLSDAGWDVYQRQKSEFEPILEPRLKADARAGLKENLLCVLRAMAG